MAKKSKSRKFIKILLVLFLLLILIVGGFVLGIYLQIFDSKEANEKLGLYKLPVVGQYFVKPPTEEDMENKPLEDVKPTLDPKDKDKGKEKTAKKMILTKEEIEKQMREREDAEKKRVSKLARLYGQMKPQEAAEAMNDIDDDLTISILQRMEESQAAKVMAKFTPAKAAQLTKLMYAGTQKKMTMPEDFESEENGNQ